MIKIKKWEDLDGKTNGYYKIRVDEYLEIYAGFTVAVEIDYVLLSSETIKKILNALGFEVEFEEPKKISKQLYYLCLAFSNTWVAVNKSGDVYVYCTRPKRLNMSWGGSAYLCTNIDIKVPLTWDDEPINTNELVTWEVEE